MEDKLQKKFTDFIFSFSNEDLLEAKKILDGILQLKKIPDVTKTNDGNLELFYKIISVNLKQKLPPLSVLQKTSPTIFESVKTANLFLDSFIDSEIGRGKLVSRSEKAILYKLYIDLMRRWFLKINVPFSLKPLLNNHAKFPALLDLQFPGYVAAGLLLRVLRTNIARAR